MKFKEEFLKAKSAGESTGSAIADTISNFVNPLADVFSYGMIKKDNAEKNSSRKRQQNKDKVKEKVSH